MNARKRQPRTAEANDTPTIQDLERAKTQGLEALGALLDRYGRRIRNWIRQAGVRDEHEVDDLQGEIGLKLLKELPKTDFASIGKFRGWVKRVATNKAIDHLRRQGRSPVRRHLDSVTTSGGTSPDVAGSQTGPLTHAVRHERVARRAALIAELPAPARELIEMHERRLMTFAEIAAAQNEKARALGIAKAKTEDSVGVSYRRLLDKVGKPVPE